jgi:hypothetical protein
MHLALALALALAHALFLFATQHLIGENYAQFFHPLKILRFCLLLFNFQIYFVQDYGFLATQRPKKISLEFPVTKENFKVASPYGGLIYVVVIFCPFDSEIGICQCVCFANR